MSKKKKIKKVDDANELCKKMEDVVINNKKDELNKLKEENKKNKLLWVMTEHVGPFKILIEVLKELLPEAILEFHQNLSKIP